LSGSRRIGHDRDLLAHESVEQARFPRVGFSCDHHRQPVAQQRALPRGGFDGAEAFEHAAEALVDRGG
jgi:hypothetical protein